MMILPLPAGEGGGEGESFEQEWAVHEVSTMSKSRIRAMNRSNRPPLPIICNQFQYFGALSEGGSRSRSQVALPPNLICGDPSVLTFAGKTAKLLLHSSSAN
jgi:hypothetical protein